MEKQKVPESDEQTGSDRNQNFLITLEVDIQNEELVYFRCVQCLGM